MLFTALTMGLAGSLHCAGMCSPLIMTASNLRGKAMQNRVVYNLGRIFTYGVLGAFMGMVGVVLPLGRFQNLLSILLGCSMVALALLGNTSFQVPGVMRYANRFTQRLKSLFLEYLNRRTLLSMMVLGAINGLLPCGLTFLALAVALNAGTVIASFSFMVLFGLGTLPVMLGFTAVADWMATSFNLSYKKLTTTLLFISGCLLVVRVFLMHDPHTLSQSQDIIDIVLCR